jgi:hypothetical protein
MKAILQQIETEIREYARAFLKSEYGEQALQKFALINISAIDAYDDGGISEATETEIKLAVKRDIDAGKLTGTTKLIIRHEMGHIFDETLPDFPEFEEEIKHEKIAWENAKPKTAAENWYKNISIRTHIDPLKMRALGFPRPETKLSSQQLQEGILAEIARMKKDSVWVDEVMAKRFAMANLVEDPTYYKRTDESSLS